MKDVRKTALRLLITWETEERFINLSLSPGVTADLSEQERRFLTALLYGTVERALTLDYYIGKLAKREAASLSVHTRNLLRLGLYQLLYMDSVPAFAAVRETVALAAHAGERGFANAVLRAATRAPELLVAPPREKNLLRHLSVAYSFPLATVRHLAAEYGREECEAMLRRYNEPAPLTLRVNTCRISRDALLDRLREAGVAAEATPYSSVGVRLSATADPTRLPGFHEGLFYVQDEASQVAVLAAEADRLPEGAVAVDTCACPGGKSFGLAMALGARGTVYSFDLHESKLSLITDGAARLGLSNIHAAVRDGRTPDPALRGAADCVLCDAPCSGLGVLGKKPDLRYRAVEEAAALPPLQEELLTAAATYVRPGGLLVYSTCTLNRAENSEVCARFRAAHPAYIPEDFCVGGLCSADGELTLLPHRHLTDGFFIARFRRAKESTV